MCNIRLIAVQSMSLIIAVNRSACTLCLNRIYAAVIFLIFNIIKFKFHLTIICIVIFLKPCCCIGIDRPYVCIISRDCRISSIWAITSWTPKTIELIALFPLLLLIIFQIITHIILIHHSPWNLCTN